jgi:hypothetical protein
LKRSWGAFFLKLDNHFSFLSLCKSLIHSGSKNATTNQGNNKGQSGSGQSKCKQCKTGLAKFQAYRIVEASVTIDANHTEKTEILELKNELETKEAQHHEQLVNLQEDLKVEQKAVVLIKKH